MYCIFFLKLRGSLRVPNENSIAAGYQARSLLRMLRPHDIDSAPLIRVGKNFDGGYVMADAIGKSSVAYSLGINDDVSWDFDVAQRDIDIFQYDHTIDQLPFEHDRFHWSKIGVSHVNEEGFITLEEMLIRNGHEDKSDIILKCDIEGAEWSMLCLTPNKIIRKFNQIVMEIHDLWRLGEDVFTNTVRQALLNITSSHTPIHIHANNYSSFAIIGGIPVPATLEVTFLRKDMANFTPSKKTFPTELDQPCNPDAADLYLGNFVF